jgi:hypothetical protein
MFFAECTANTNTPTPWSPAPVGVIGDAHTNQTAPNVPNSPACVAGALEVSDDGKVDAQTDFSWTAPTGGVPVKSYMVKVTQVANGKVRYIHADGLSLSVDVKTGKSYNFQVAAVNAFGKIGAYTTAVAFTRSKKPAGTVPAGGTLTLTALKKRIVVDYADVNESTYPDYRTTYVYRNTTGTTPTPGVTASLKQTRSGRFVDEGVVTGTTYFYWVAHQDLSLNFGTISSVASTSSGGNEVSAFSDLSGSIVTGQIPAGTVTNAQTDQTLPATPGSGPTVAQKNKDLNGDGTVDMAFKLSVGSLPSGANAVIYHIDEYDSLNTTLLDSFEAYPHKLITRIPVVAGHYYRVTYAGVAYPSGNVGGYNSTPTVLQATAKSTGPASPSPAGVTASYPLSLDLNWNGAGGVTDADYDHTDIFISSVNTTPASNQVADFSISNRYGGRIYLGQYIPVGINYLWFAHVNRSGVRSSWVAYGGGTPLKFITSGIDGTVIPDNTIRERFQAQTNSSQALTTSGAVIETTPTSHNTGCNTIDVWLFFRNVSGGTRTFTITLEDGSGTVMNTWTTIAIDDNGFFSASWTLVSPAGSSTNFKMRAVPITAATINNTRLVCVTGRR